MTLGEWLDQWLASMADTLRPNPLRPDQPADPGSVYRRLKTLLKQAGLPSIRFHGLGNMFATNALEQGVDVKTLSTIIGHISSATTLNIYAHITDKMQRQAAAKIDRGIGRAEAAAERERLSVENRAS